MQAADVARSWDKVVDGFLRGSSKLQGDLAEWRASYQWHGDGAIEERALPEPFLGGLKAPVECFIVFPFARS